MIACPRCGGESPDGSLHCVQCGARLGEAPHQSTQFGMPQLRPAGPNSKGPQTTQFGAEDLARLAAAAADESEPPTEASSPPQPSTPAPSLMAGLPRPRVTSAPSPLTEGLKQPVRAQPAQPSARSTVMGMPIYSEAFGTPAAAAPQKVAEPETPEDGPAMLVSLADFGSDSAPSAAQSAQAASVASESTPSVEVGRALTEEDAPPTIVDSPEAREMAREASSASRKVVIAPPETAAEVAFASEAETEPAAPGNISREMSDPRPVPKPAVRTAAQAAADARSARSTAWEDEGDSDGGGLSRGLAFLVGASLVGLVVYPARRQWFWDALSSMDGMPKTAFMAAAGCGVAALLTAVIPMPPKVRNVLTIALGIAGVAGLAMS